MPRCVLHGIYSYLEGECPACLQTDSHIVECGFSNHVNIVDAFAQKGYEVDWNASRVFLVFHKKGKKR
jgi:hypothetical protein